MYKKKKGGEEKESNTKCNKVIIIKCQTEQ